MTISDIILTPVLLDLRFFDCTYQYYSVLKNQPLRKLHYLYSRSPFDYILCDKSVLKKLSTPNNVKNGSVQKVSWRRSCYHNTEIGRDAYFGDYEEVADDEDL